MNFNQITINQFQEIVKSIKENEDNKYQLAMDLMFIFDNIPYSESENIKVKDIDKHLTKYKFLFDNDLDKIEWVKSFEFEGKNYKVNQYIHEWTTSEYISMSTIIKTGEPLEHLHKLIAVMCKDENHLMTRAENFKRLPIIIAYPLMVFFCGVMAKFQGAMPTYLQAEGLPIGSAKNGDGTTSWQMFKKSLELLKTHLKQMFSTS